MIPYEELVAALDRYVARRGGTPASAHAPSPPSPSAPSAFEPPTGQVSMPPVYDEHRDPDLPRGQHEEDATHVGASPGGMQHPEDHSNEIDIGDVLADDEL